MLDKLKPVSPQTAVLTSLLTTVLLVPDVAAQIPCGGRSEIIKHLQETQGEYLVNYAVAHNGQLIEVYASDSGQFTMIVTIEGQPGMACIIATGQGYESVKRQARLEEQPI